MPVMTVKDLQDRINDMSPEGNLEAKRKVINELLTVILKFEADKTTAGSDTAKLTKAKDDFRIELEKVLGKDPVFRDPTSAFSINYQSVDDTQVKALKTALDLKFQQIMLAEAKWLEDTQAILLHHQAETQKSIDDANTALATPIPQADIDALHQAHTAFDEALKTGKQLEEKVKAAEQARVAAESEKTKKQSAYDASAAPDADAKKALDDVILAVTQKTEAEKLARDNLVEHQTKLEQMRKQIETYKPIKEAIAKHEAVQKELDAQKAKADAMEAMNAPITEAKTAISLAANLKAKKDEWEKAPPAAVDAAKKSYIAAQDVYLRTVERYRTDLTKTAKEKNLTMLLDTINPITRSPSAGSSQMANIARGSKLYFDQCAEHITTDTPENIRKLGGIPPKDNASASSIYAISKDQDKQDAVQFIHLDKATKECLVTVGYYNNGSSAPPTGPIVLKQEADGSRITDCTDSKVTLSEEQKSWLAIDKAKMLMNNVKPGHDLIVINATEPGESQKIHAALLLIQNTLPYNHPARGCTISNRCKKSPSSPPWLGKDSWIEEQLSTTLAPDIVANFKAELKQGVKAEGDTIKQAVRGVKDGSGMFNRREVDSPAPPTAPTPKGPGT